MDFQWEITSRTGEQYQGTDEFPSSEQKDSANSFTLFLSYPCAIQAPYGQNVLGTKIELIVPDGHKLVFKRRVRFSVGQDLEECGERNHIYIIAFEKVKP